MDTYPDVRWSSDRSETAGYVVIVVSDLFGGQEEKRSYDFACPPKLKGRRTLSVAAYYGRDRGEKGSWRRL